MALTRRKWTECVLILLTLLFCISESESDDRLCKNENISCTDVFLSSTNASSRDCMLLAHRGKACEEQEFKVGASPSVPLGEVGLKVYPFRSPLTYLSFNITLKDINWTSLRFRYKELGVNNPTYFCREFQISPHHDISELYFDCYSSPATKQGHNFTFEYQAEAGGHISARRYVLTVPYFTNIEEGTLLENFTPFMYVDITDLPDLIVRWQQVPFPGVRYGVEIYNWEEGWDKELINSQIYAGTNNSDEELSHRYNTFHCSGNLLVVVRVLNGSCPDGKCGFFSSPVIDVGDTIKKMMLVGIVGSVVLIPLFLFIVFMWKRQCPPTRIDDEKLPLVLIVHSPSRESHLNAVIALTEYLRNHCFVNVLLDQLDIPDTEDKDPWSWYNNAFQRADFVMIVSSPPKCCYEEGIFVNMDAVALNFFKEKFCCLSLKPRFFSVMLPYCSEKDVPVEAKNLRAFKLIKDLDKMLLYVHNGGRLPTILDSVRSFLGPKPYGGKSDLKVKGTRLLSVLKEAEKDRGKFCSCKSKVKGSDKEAEFKCTSIMRPAAVPKIDDYLEEKDSRNRNISESDSTSCLLPIDITFVDIQTLPLSGKKQKLSPVPTHRREAAHQAGFSIHSLQL